MAAQKIEIVRQIDARLLEAFQNIAADCATSDDATVNLRLAERHRTPIEAKLSDLSENGSLQTLLAEKAATFDQLKLQLPRFGNAAITIDRQNGFDLATVSFDDTLALEDAATLVAATHRHLRPINRAESISRMLGDELSEFYQRREEGLAQLEHLSHRLIEENEQYRQKIDSQFLDQKAGLESLMDDRRVALEKEFEEKNEGLNAGRKALEEREKELDDRDSKHARRELRKDLKAALESRSREFTLTRKTNNKRIGIHIIFISLMLVFGFVIGNAFIQQLETTPDPIGDSNPNWIRWFRMLKLGLGAMAFAATAIYYIRWNDHWFRQHADEEFRLKRLELDIDRASWIVEMALEWQDEKGTAIPEELIDRLTTGLFSDSTRLDAPRHPNEDLSDALLGASSGLTMNVPGMGELKLDRKGIRNFAKAAGKTDSDADT